MCLKLTADKGRAVFYICVFQKSRTLLVELHCISEPYSKNVVNTNIAFLWVTTLYAISFKLFASC